MLRILVRFWSTLKVLIGFSGRKFVSSKNISSGDFTALTSAHSRLVIDLKPREASLRLLRSLTRFYRN
jgi:hypothetical protein